MIKEIVLPDDELGIGKEEDLVSSHAGYANILLADGYYLVDELPITSRIAFAVSIYEAEVLNGGHEQFVSNGSRIPFYPWKRLFPDVETGLKSIEAEEFLTIFREFKCLLASEGALEEAMAARSGFNHPQYGEPDQRVDEIDSRFFALHRAKPLAFYTAAFIRRDPLFSNCRRSEWHSRLNKLAAENPLREERRALREIEAQREKAASEQRRATLVDMCGQINRVVDPNAEILEFETADDETKQQYTAYVTTTSKGQIALVQTPSENVLISFPDGTELLRIVRSN